jgi:hypothetical protein
MCWPPVVLPVAHGSKQLRAPERGHQRSHQRAHQRYAHVSGPEPARKQQQQPANGAAQHLKRHASSQPQQQQAVNSTDGNVMACMPPGGQLQEGFAACDPRMGMLQPQLLNGACANGDGSGPLPACGSMGSGDMMQLLQKLAEEVSATRHEAAEHSRVAAAAQQKLQQLEQLLGCGMSNTTNYGGGYGSVSAGPSTGCTPLTSPVANTSWASGPLPSVQQMPSAASYLLAMQQLAAQGDFDGPRRHSLDEALLRRARNLPGWYGNAGRSSTLWNASPSAMVSSLAAVTEGMALNVPPGSAAAADAEALGAALAAARGQGVDGCFSGMSAGGLVSGSSLMSSSAGHSSWMGGMQQPDGASQVWSQPDLAWAGAVGLGGAFNSATLPSIPHTAPGLNGRSSISAPVVQQSDYLAQMHAALQDSNFAMSLGMLPGQRPPVRASFDTAAAYMPSLPPVDLQAAASQHNSAAAVAAELAASNAPSSGSSSMDVPIVLPDALTNNPIGGAHQLGWF